MSDYQTKRVEITGTTALAVTKMLTRLAGFGDGARFFKTGCRSPMLGSQTTILAYHPDTMKSDMPLLAEPDIQVTGVFNVEKGSVDGYEIEFDSRVTPNLVDQLKYNLQE